MKKVILSVAVVMSLALTNCKNEAKESVETTETKSADTSKDMAMADISFGVRGNCGM